MGGISPVVDDTEPERILPGSNYLYLLNLGHPPRPLTPVVISSGSSCGTHGAGQGSGWVLGS